MLQILVSTDNIVPWLELIGNMSENPLSLEHRHALKFNGLAHIVMGLPGTVVYFT